MAQVTKAQKQALSQRLARVEGAVGAKQGERHTGAKPATQVPAAARRDMHGPGPRVRTGESALTSRGYRYTNAFGVMAGRTAPQDAKVEMDAHGVLHKALGSLGMYPSHNSSVWVPFWLDAIPDELFQKGERRAVQQMVKAGAVGADPDEMRWLSTKAVTGGMSWRDEYEGGALVGPPEFGELIELFRNKAAVTAAGATTIPLPPTGRIQWPRQIGVTTGYWLGENTDATKSFPQTGTMTLSGKKCMGLAVLPNELLRFATVASEQLVRSDLTKSLALTADLAFLDGEGGDLKPLGLLAMAENSLGVETVTPTTVANDGNTLAPQDLFSFISTVEENNAEFEGFILRPTLFYKFVQARAGIYNGSAMVSQGQFVFDQFRQLGDKTGGDKVLGGYKATVSANVPKNRVKGNGTTLTALIGGMWSDFIVAMFGAVEFAQTDGGITLLTSDQCAIRAILTCDGGPRHPGAFAVADDLLTNVAN